MSNPYFNPRRDPSDGIEHIWVAPSSAPCSDCPCCSAALCVKAQDEGSACHFIGGSSDFDLSLCPCWHKPGRERNLASLLQHLKAKYPHLSYLEIRALELAEFNRMLDEDGERS